MKNRILLLALLVIITTSLGSGCKKNKLPPATQTGAYTFGCLVDGKVFLPKGSPFAGPVIKAQYQYVNGKQGFAISARHSEGETGQTVSIGGDSITITERTYELATRNISGKLAGAYTFSKVTTLGNYYYTTEIQRGQIVIKNFDEMNQIVSGTFWFDAIDSTTGKIIQIREGRFDLPYVR